MIPLVSTLHNGKGNILNTAKRIILVCFSLILAFSFIFFYPTYAEASMIKNDKLIEKISKDYTNKFCNSIGFGLSKDSAMAFANKENNMIFKNRNGFDNLNKELIANKIAVSVIENCGYPINLKGEKGIEEFEKDYISMNELDSQ